MIKAKEVSERLAAQIERVCEVLLPNGKRNGSEWCVGSPAGEAGDSMRVHLVGDKAGIWAEFSGDQKGDALDLWAACKNLSMPEAMRDAKRWLGIPVHEYQGKTYEKPNRPDNLAKLSAGPVQSYLTAERKIEPETLAKFKVAGDKGGHGYYMPSFNLDGEFIRFKWVGLKRENGKKVTHSSTNSAPILYGWQAVAKEARSILICEGEIDAMTWSQWGIPALSVPNGAGNVQWLELEWTNLEAYDEIYISFDMDDAGQKNVTAIANRLGLHRVKIVKLPAKDANAWLMSGATVEDAAKALASASVISPSQFVNLVEFVDEAYELITNPNKGGIRTSILRDKMVFRPGETTVVSGYPGHGKSTLLSNIIVEAAANNHRSVIVSMEMPVPFQLGMMTKQFFAKGNITKEDMVKFASWASDKIYPLDMTGIVDCEKVLECVEYGIRRYDCRFAVVDSIMKLNINSDDYEGQRQAMNRLTQFAADNRIHLFIVAHPNKSGSEKDPPDMMHIRGSQDLVAMPDNVLMVWRNKQKEEMESQNQVCPGAPGVVRCVKQRRTGDLFRMDYEYHRNCAQFTTENASPTCYAITTMSVE